MKVSEKCQESIHKFIKKEIDDGKLVGANVSLIKDGEEIFHGEYGYADLENKVPMQKDTIFKMYSMTKPITAVAVMMLFERGLFSLKDPVSLYLPGFRNQKVIENGVLAPVHREVTIQDLLNMTSGLVYPDADEAGALMDKVFAKAVAADEAGQSFGTVEFANMIGEVPLAFQPGTKWRYGSNTDILGALVEVLSGKRFGDFLQEELFQPLEMNDTDFYVPAEKWNRFAKCYEMDWEKKTAVPYKDKNLMILDFKQMPAFQSGGAGLASTLMDYAKFTQMLLAGGTVAGRKYLSRKTVDFMTSNHLTPEQLTFLDWDELLGYGYGCCMRVLTDVAKSCYNGTVGEFGWGGWMGTYVAMDPVENMTILLGIQRLGVDNTRFIRMLKTLAYSAL